MRYKRLIFYASVLKLISSSLSNKSNSLQKPCKCNNFRVLYIIFFVFRNIAVLHNYSFVVIYNTNSPVIYAVEKILKKNVSENIYLKYEGNIIKLKKSLLA